MKKKWIFFCVLAVILLAGGFKLMRILFPSPLTERPTLTATYNEQTLDAAFYYLGPGDPFYYFLPFSTHTVKANSVLKFSYSVTPRTKELFGDEILIKQIHGGKYFRNNNFAVTMPSKPGRYSLDINTEWGFNENGYCRMFFWVFDDLPQCQPYVNLQKRPTLTLSHEGESQDVEYAFVGISDNFTVSGAYINATFSVKTNSPLTFSFDTKPIQMITELYGLHDSAENQPEIYTDTDQVTLTAPSTPGKYSFTLAVLWSDHETGYCSLQIEVEG